MKNPSLKFSTLIFRSPVGELRVVSPRHFLFEGLGYPIFFGCKNPAFFHGVFSGSKR